MNQSAIKIGNARLFLLFIFVLASFMPGTNNTMKGVATPSQKTVPFKGRIVTMFRVLDDASSIQKIDIMGSGITTHLGNTTFLGHVVLDFSTDPVVDTGHGTFTAANGDMFFTDYSGTTTLENGVYVGENEHIIKGGTGRFNGATGMFKAYVMNNPKTGTGQQTFEGYITY